MSPSVPEPERQVVDYANVVLDRLSGGQLYFQLCGVAGGEDNTAKGLELAAVNRTTGEKPINVAFLSGSQKFRVAVSLALGQYASRQHRAIEAVIIGEGFGCVDRQGRQVMIQEWQNPRGQLRCIPGFAPGSIRRGLCRRLSLRADRRHDAGDAVSAVICTGPAESRTSATAPSGTMSPSALRTLSCLMVSASTRKGASAWTLTCQVRPKRLKSLT